MFVGEMPFDTLYVGKMSFDTLYVVEMSFDTLYVVEMSFDIHCTSGNSIRCALGRNVIRYVIRRGNSICYVFLRGKCHLIRCTSGKCHLICWMSGKCYSIRNTKEKMSFEPVYVGKMSSVEALWEWVCPTFKYALCILFCRASLSTTRLVGVPGQGSHPSSWSACPPTIPRRPSWSSPSTLRPM